MHTLILIIKGLVHPTAGPLALAQQVITILSSLPEVDELGEHPLHLGGHSGIVRGMESAFIIFATTNDRLGVPCGLIQPLPDHVDLLFDLAAEDLFQGEVGCGRCKLDLHGSIPQGGELGTYILTMVADIVDIPDTRQTGDCGDNCKKRITVEKFATNREILEKLSHSPILTSVHSGVGKVRAASNSKSIC
uniref:Uncharacterized protein n=1 Tax=Magnetococcus massalia (strain MO-1) TaxID=451514 RepID=A0A1S7LPR7_MAGMO|nr:protein of unknown function [Candidatus Magnetococcus massalia]